MSSLHPSLVRYFTERMEAMLPRVGAARMVLCVQLPRDVAAVAMAGGETQGSFESFPVDFAGRRIGVLRAESSTRAFFTPESKGAMEALAAQFAPLWDLSDEREILAAIELDQRMESLKNTQPKFDWCGIYRVSDGTLRLTAFRGAPTPHPVIETAKGICGAAVSGNTTLNIPDVAKDPRYLSCDLRTRSELVVPIRDGSGRPIGEIDIDSHAPAAFDDALTRTVEQLSSDLRPLMIKFK